MLNFSAEITKNYTQLKCNKERNPTTSQKAVLFWEKDITFV